MSQAYQTNEHWKYEQLLAREDTTKDYKNTTQPSKETDTQPMGLDAYQGKKRKSLLCNPLRR